MKIYLAILLCASVVFGFTLVENSPAPASQPTTEEKVDWEKMDHEARVQYMRTEVLPTMRQLFTAFDPVRFERINCKTCHGDGVTNETYKMPNPKLPKLPSSTEGFMELMKRDSAIMNFMMYTVKPEMAKLLGMRPSDPIKKIEGFGCNNCHTFKKDQRGGF